MFFQNHTFICDTLHFSYDESIFSKIILLLMKHLGLNKTNGTTWNENVSDRESEEIEIEIEIEIKKLEEDNYQCWWWS